MVPPEKLKPITPLSQVEHSTTGWLYRYYTAIRSLYRHTVCHVPASCKHMEIGTSCGRSLTVTQKLINNYLF